MEVKNIISKYKFNCFKLNAKFSICQVIANGKTEEFSCWMKWILI